MVAQSPAGAVRPSAPSRALEVRQAATQASDEREAVAELLACLGPGAAGPTSATLFFCSPKYELGRLAAYLRAAFPTKLFGCTSSGQLGRGGFQRGGISALRLASPDLFVELHLLEPLASATQCAARIGAAVRARRAPPRPPAFGFLCIDGLSLAEERVASSLYSALGDVPLIGGSAGDDLSFEATHVFVDGAFRRDAAVLAYIETNIPFRVFKFQHFVPTAQRLVITDAVPDARIVTEIDGEVAAEAYARLVGRAVSELTAEVFSQNPLLLCIADEHYVRSIQRMNPDGSLTFLCAIEPGLVLHIGRGVDVLAAVREGLAARPGEGPASVVLGCDCILRRLEFEGRGLATEVGAVLAEHEVFGFSTYGEQYNAIHVNQTFTGIRLGG